ncbi:MAG: TolC family protein [Myxococcales bacterium]|nr:TolC family protein [Myxococcales bacterium]
MGYGGSLEVPFDVGGAPPARAREAERGIDLAKADVDVQRRRARREVWSAYVRVRASERRVEEIQSVLRIAERIVQASARRAAAGAAGDVDEMAARSELAVLQGLAESAARQRESQLMELRGLLDLDAGRRLDLVTPLAEPAPAAAEADLISRALSRRPELARSRARVAQLVATDARLAQELFPRLSVYLGVDAAPVSPIFGQVGLSVELPVAQRNQRARAVAQRQRSTEETLTALLLRQIVRDVSAARAAYEGRRRELHLLSRTALPAAERTLELVELGWIAGRFDIFRVTTAARDVARVRALRIDALEAAWLEHVALDYTVGGTS